MSIKFTQNEIIIKGLFTKKIPFESVKSLKIKSNTIEVALKDGGVKRYVDRDALYIENPDLSILQKYNFDFIHFPVEEYFDSPYVEKLIEGAKQKIKDMLDPQIKDYFGNEYELVLENDYESDTYSLIIAISQNGVRLKNFAGYEEDESYLDHMEVAFFCKWDPIYRAPLFEVVPELLDDHVLKAYVDDTMDIIIENCNSNK